MAEFLAPGVFLEEVSFRARRIAGVQTTTGSPAVREAVRALLVATPSFRELGEGEQRAIAGHMVSVAAELADGAADLADAVDFPAFVADLVNATFGAIVDASIRQMEAYGRLLDEADASLEGGEDDGADDDDRRRRLAARVRAGVHRIVAHDERPSFFDGRLLDARDLALEQDPGRPHRHLRPPP